MRQLAQFLRLHPEQHPLAAPAFAAYWEADLKSRVGLALTLLVEQ